MPEYIAVCGLSTDAMAVGEPANADGYDGVYGPFDFADRILIDRGFEEEVDGYWLNNQRVHGVTLVAIILKNCEIRPPEKFFLDET